MGPAEFILQALGILALMARTVIVGATGAVGRELIGLLETSTLGAGDVVALAGSRSSGASIPFRDKELLVRSSEGFDFRGVDLAFFCASSQVARELAPAAAAAGALVVDNSSAFRMDPKAPLIIPEVNPEQIRRGPGITANPNCSTIILLMAAAPLRQFGRIRRIIVSTYQAASGAGQAAMQELRDQTLDYLHGAPIMPKVMPHPYAFNLFSHDSPMNEHGWNGEEWKMLQESRKILGQEDLGVNATCVRVPILRAHSESITVEFDGPAPDPEAVRSALAHAPGVRVVDEADRFPMPNEATGQRDVLVGRIRRDLSNPNGLCLFACGDQLLKGAALNALQIAEAALA
jgi:aspartate-semialdehyde dehydrogenase